MASSALSSQREPAQNPPLKGIQPRYPLITGIKGPAAWGSSCWEGPGR